MDVDKGKYGEEKTFLFLPGKRIAVNVDKAKHYEKQYYACT